MIDLISCTSKQEASFLASMELSSLLGELKKNQQPTLLLLSGGSAFSLTETIDGSALGNHMTIGVLDERYSADPAINNFSQLITTKLYTAGVATGCSFIDTRIQHNESQQELSVRFGTALKEWRKAYPQGTILITQGIGPDGHTSGVLPFPENPVLFKTLFENSDSWTAAYDATGKNQYALRVTTTLSFLKEVTASIVFVCGTDKTEALKKALNPESVPEITPARIIQDMKHVSIFTDIKLQ